MESFGGYIEQSWSERSREYSVSVCNVGTQLSLQRKALQSCEPSSSVADSNTPKIKATQCHRRLNLGSGVGPPLRLFPRSGLHPENGRGIGCGSVFENAVSRVVPDPSVDSSLQQLLYETRGAEDANP